MYDDDEIQELIEEEISHDQLVSQVEIQGEPPTPDMIEQFGFFIVKCKSGCGLFPLEEAEVLGLDLHQGTATFRCRICNDIQTAELLVID